MAVGWTVSRAAARQPELAKKPGIGNSSKASSSSLAARSRAIFLPLSRGKAMNIRVVLYVECERGREFKTHRIQDTRGAY